MEESIHVEILKELQKKYQCMTEIERITREMETSLSRNDRTVVQMLLGMRQEEMDQADNCDRNIKCLLSAISPSESDRIRGWLNGREEQEPDSQAAKLMMEKGRNIRLARNRTIEVDRQISRRLAGKDSYYQ